MKAKYCNEECKCLDINELKIKDEVVSRNLTCSQEGIPKQLQIEKGQPLRQLNCREKSKFCGNCPRLKDTNICSLYHEVMQLENGETVKFENCERLDADRITREEMFSRIVEITGKRSSCHRGKIGAIIVRNNRIISQGYNGPASGIDCDICLGPGCDRSIHAEINAIVFAAKYGVSIDGADLYCSMSPCVNCAKAIINSGISRVYFEKEYRDTKGIDILVNSGVRVYKLEDK